MSNALLLLGFIFIVAWPEKYYIALAIITVVTGVISMMIGAI